MKPFLTFNILFLLFATIACANELLGTWQFTEYNYEGHTVPAPNPNLILRFTFDAEDISTLKWFRTDEAGLCERKAKYALPSDHQLVQTIIWVDPRNNSACATDSDMQMGRKSVTPYHVEDHKLYLEMELNGKPFYYILAYVQKPQ